MAVQVAPGGGGEHLLVEAALGADHLEPGDLGRRLEGGEAGPGPLGHEEGRPLGPWRELGDRHDGVEPAPEGDEQLAWVEGADRRPAWLSGAHELEAREVEAVGEGVLAEALDVEAAEER